MSHELASSGNFESTDGSDTADALLSNLKNVKGIPGRVFPSIVFGKQDPVDTGKSVENFFRRTFGPLELGFFESGEPDENEMYKGLEYYDFLVGVFSENRAIKDPKTEALNLKIALGEWKENTGIVFSLEDLHLFSKDQRNAYLMNWYESPEKQKPAFLENAHDWETVRNIVKTAISPKNESFPQQFNGPKEAYVTSFLSLHFRNEEFNVSEEEAGRLRDGLTKWIDERMEYARDTGIDGDEDLKDLKDLSLKDVLKYSMDRFGFWVIKSDIATTKNEYDKAQEQVLKWRKIMELSILAAKSPNIFKS